MSDSSIPSSRPLFHNTEAIRQQQYAESLASQWQSALQQSADPATARQLTAQLAPLLVEALSELLKEVEREAKREALHAEYMNANPVALPRYRLSTSSAVIDP